jgi:hypothetical protein
MKGEMSVNSGTSVTSVNSRRQIEEVLDAVRPMRLPTMFYKTGKFMVTGFPATPHSFESNPNAWTL